DYARIQAVIGRYLIAKGRPVEGTALLESVAHIGPAICLEHPERNFLITQMIARALVGVAAEGFILAAADLHPGRDQARAIGESLRHAIALLPPLSYSFSLERKVIPSFPAAYRKQAERTHSARGLIRAAEFEQVAAKAEPHLKKLFDPWTPLLDLPWSEAWPKLFEAARANDDYINKYISVEGPANYIRSLLDPSESAARIMLSIVIPSPAGAFKGIWQTHQKIEGARTVLAIEAFRKERNRLPGTMTELAAWWGTAIGEDYFSGRSLLYDSKRPSLASVGPDQMPNTTDDILFLPLEDLVK
ncbi:MAG TPA: hypothetical protein PKM25_16255, partial [Candidatus Ozemobacteraceae bacterium]|nr:hypothetical protein [Candidatus Ozemobacteraceae bacterium]